MKITYWEEDLRERLRQHRFQQNDLLYYELTPCYLSYLFRELLSGTLLKRSLCLAVSLLQESKRKPIDVLMIQPTEISLKTCLLTATSPETSWALIRVKSCTSAYRMEKKRLFNGAPVIPNVENRDAGKKEKSKQEWYFRKVNDFLRHKQSINEVLKIYCLL